MTKRIHKGFTLVELLVVIAIIGLLSTLAVVALNTARAKSRDSKRVADIRQIQTALELYYSDKGQYPAQTVTLGGASSKVLCSGATLNGFQATATACHATAAVTYMGLVPAAPTPYDSAACATLNPYNYTSTDGSTYSIGYCVGGQVGDVTAAPHTAQPSGIQ